MNESSNGLPLCRYCGEQEAALQSREDGARRASRYRGRPCCAECRETFESGSRPKPLRPQRGGSTSRNGRSDRQRFPNEPDFGWDDAVRVIEECFSN